MKHIPTICGLAFFISSVVLSVLVIRHTTLAGNEKFVAIMLSSVCIGLLTSTIQASFKH